MIPIVLDPQVTRMALIGRGIIAERRLASLDEGSVANLTVFSDLPSRNLMKIAGDRLEQRLPTSDDLTMFHAIWIADLPTAIAIPLAIKLRDLGKLVNVEDVKDWCDFHNPALVRRGDLLLTVSTNGQSPGLAARIKKQLSIIFGPEWAHHLQVIGAKRDAWKRRDRSLSELARLTDATIDAKGWLASVRK